jgi:hypothetical protein
MARSSIASAMAAPGRAWSGPVLFGLTVVALIAAAGITLRTAQAAADAGRVGADLTLYVDATRRALAGGAFYPSDQLAGPFAVADGDILYPPTVMFLVAPFLVLPAVLFWIVPIGIIAAVVAWHRPQPWAWPLVALALAWPITSLKVVHGNPVMWIVAAIALATIHAWPAILVLIKPSLAPFALIGIRHRSWWIALAVFACASTVFGALWLDYVRVVVNSRNPNGLLYSLDEVPMMLIPVIAWLGSSRPRNREPDGPTAAEG